MFQRAERKKAKLRLAINGPSGSGKTYSALQIAQGLAPGGKIAMLDTERGSGELYAHICEYDVAPLAPPFSPDRYTKIIKGAELAGYDVLIIDSLSHAWSGDGGILDLHDKATSAERSRNSFMAWREVTPKHNALVDTILAANLHVIVTMRTKTAYEIVENDKGKKTPMKIGMAPIQRDGMEYEFTAVLDLSVDNHVATASKDRTGIFDGQHFVPTVATGESLRTWLDDGVEAPKLADVLDAINESSSLEELNVAGSMAGKLASKSDKDAARTAYVSRKAELTTPTAADEHEPESDAA
jgi:hypothetical protein